MTTIIFALTLAKFQRYVRIDAAARRKKNRAKYEQRKEEIEKNLTAVEPLPPVDNLNHIPLYPAGVMRYVHSTPKLSEIQPAKNPGEKGVEQKWKEIEETPKVRDKSDFVEVLESPVARRKSARRKGKKKKTIAKDHPTENSRNRKLEDSDTNEMLLVTSTLIKHL
ncbi:unnamed protein product [Cylicocyclus nassatus]|uniref:Uncharacterized protein n=1 Tax=Cylicocyclus nassatus TaxID=53992 RepID=A0AA36HD51_CYLNA|nr:unnamed protein product [Cylicocyclus nassatus]